MFFTKQDFGLLHEQEAEVAAKIANDIIGKRGKVLFGNYYKNEVVNFSDQQKDNDTHVCIAINLAEMGHNAPPQSELVLDKVTESERTMMLQKKVQELEKTNQILRSNK